MSKLLTSLTLMATGLLLTGCQAATSSREKPSQVSKTNQVTKKTNSVTSTAHTKTVSLNITRDKAKAIQLGTDTQATLVKRFGQPQKSDNSSHDQHQRATYDWQEQGQKRQLSVSFIDGVLWKKSYFIAPAANRAHRDDPAFDHTEVGESAEAVIKRLGQPDSEKWVKATASLVKHDAYYYDAGHSRNHAESYYFENNHLVHPQCV